MRLCIEWFSSALRRNLRCWRIRSSYGFFGPCLWTGLYRCLKLKGFTSQDFRSRHSKVHRRGAVGGRAQGWIACGAGALVWGRSGDRNVMVRVHRHHDALSLSGSIQSVTRSAALIAFGFLQGFVFTAVEKVLATCVRVSVICNQAVRRFFKLSPQQALDKSCRSGKQCCRTLRFAPA